MPPSAPSNSSKFGEFQHQAQRERLRSPSPDAVNMCCCPQIIMTGSARRPSEATGRRCPTWCWLLERAEMDPEHAHLDELLK
jgi:hypothetical protein